MPRTPKSTIGPKARAQKRGANHYGPRDQNYEPTSEYQDADALTASLSGRQASGWSQVLTAIHGRYQKKEAPPALLALHAMRCLVDGALINQRLIGRFIQPGPTKTPSAPGDLAQERCETDLITVPWWVVAELTDCFIELINAARKEVTPPPGTNKKVWRNWTAKRAAEMLGAQGNGRGNRGYLWIQETGCRGGRTTSSTRPAVSGGSDSDRCRTPSPTKDGGSPSLEEAWKVGAIYSPPGRGSLAAKRMCFFCNSHLIDVFASIRPVDNPTGGTNETYDQNTRAAEHALEPAFPYAGGNPAG